MRTVVAASAAFAASLLLGCADNAHLPATAGIGAAPALPPPTESAIPTIAVAPAQGWAADEAPTPAAGLRVTAFARGLDHPRWLHVLPDGDVLVAESNAQPSRPKSLRDVVMKLTQGIAGAEVPSPDRILLLRDADGDGVAETRTVFLSGLTSPFGMALVGDDLYVADTDALLRFPYRTGETQIAAPGRRGGRIARRRDQPPLDQGARRQPGRPDALRLGRLEQRSRRERHRRRGGPRGDLGDRPGNRRARVFASGLRNPVGMDFEPHTGTLWTVVNERDELGGDLVPDYLTSVQAGGFYGWPYSYYGDHLDPRVDPQRPDLVAQARVPDYALGPHGAPLGLTFADGAKLGPRFTDGAFIGQHGSWNRKPQYGYRVIFVPFRHGRPAGPPVEVLTDFLDDAGNARGRPVGVVIDKRGGLLVADDVGNAVWRVSAR